MKNQMMAAVLYGKEHLQVEPVAVPTLEQRRHSGARKAALTCGTDVKVFRRGYHARMIVPPAVFGHELAGRYRRRRRGRQGSFRLGERVVAANSAPCDDVISASAVWRICARICCSITARTPSTSAFRRASWSGTCT